MLRIHFTCFFLLLFNVATRKLKILSVIRIVLLSHSTGLTIFNEKNDDNSEHVYSSTVPGPVESPLLIYSHHDL